MKKYFRIMVCLGYSFVKFSFIKLFHINGFRFTFFNIVSPFTEIEIGNNAKLSLKRKVRIRSGSKVRVRNDAEVEIGENSSLNNNCTIISHEKILIGQDVQLGPNVIIYDHDHDFRAENGLKNLKYKTSPVIIGDNVWIGANVVILRGTKIGDNCVVGAGSVIKGEYPENTTIIQRRFTEVINYKL